MVIVGKCVRETIAKIGRNNARKKSKTIRKRENKKFKKIKDISEHLRTVTLCSF